MPRCTTSVPMSLAPTMLSMQVCSYAIECAVEWQAAAFLYAPIATPNPCFIGIVAKYMRSLASGLNGLPAPQQRRMRGIASWTSSATSGTTSANSWSGRVYVVDISCSIGITWPTHQTDVLLLSSVPWRYGLQDNSQMGIKATLSRLNAALKAHDRELWCHLEVKNQVCPDCSIGGQSCFLQPAHDHILRCLPCIAGQSAVLCVPVDHALADPGNIAAATAAPPCAQCSPASGMCFPVTVMYPKCVMGLVADMQEFSFPDAVRLWDTLLADPSGRADCLLRLCIAMLVHVRAELLAVSTQPCQWCTMMHLCGVTVTAGLVTCLVHLAPFVRAAGRLLGKSEAAAELSINRCTRCAVDGGAARQSGRLVTVCATSPCHAD
jgi:hypothetical protein